MIGLLVACTDARPDLVLVTLDTTRADRIGAYGYAQPTPAIDRLAAEGRRFDHAYSAIPLTIPSHAALFTGRYPPHTGVRAQDTALPPAATTLAEQLRGAGYATAGFVGGVVTSRTFGFDQGFDTFDDAMHGDERSAAEVVDQALAWEHQTHEGHQPRFMWVHLYDPHLPNRPNPGHPDPYDAAIADCDQAVARLREAFDGRPTVFSVVADHGESRGDHDEVAHGWYVYPATQRVPWVMAGPGIPAGEVDPDPVSLVDVAPTLLAAVGAPALPATDGRVVPGEPRPVYLESWQLAQRFHLAPHRGLVDGSWLLVDVPRPELYDLGADPLAATDRSAQEPDRVRAMQRELAAFGFEAPPPPPVVLDPQQLAQLAGLGYVAAGPPPPGPLPDPKDHPDLLAQTQQAEQLTLVGRFADAEPLLAAAIAKWPDVSELHGRRAWALAGLGRFPEAGVELRAALSLDPADAQLQIALASELASARRFDEASAVFQAAAQAAPTAPRVREMAVLSLLDGGHPAEAEALALSFLDQQPQNASLSGLLGVAVARQGRLDEADPLLALDAATERPEPNVLYTWSAMWAGRGDRARAVELLDRELSLRPGSSDSLIARCGFHRDAGEVQAMRALAEPVLARTPGEPIALACEAAALLDGGDRVGARAVVDRALAAAPDLPLAVAVDRELGRP